MLCWFVGVHFVFLSQQRQGRGSLFTLIHKQAWLSQAVPSEICADSVRMVYLGCHLWTLCCCSAAFLASGSRSAPAPASSDAVCSLEIVGVPTKLSQLCSAWPLCVCRNQQLTRGGAEAAALWGIGVVRGVVTNLNVLAVVTGSSCYIWAGGKKASECEEAVYT